MTPGVEAIVKKMLGNTVLPAFLGARKTAVDKQTKALVLSCFGGNKQTSKNIQFIGYHYNCCGENKARKGVGSSGGG